MPKQNDELIGIITKFAESGWDLIDAPSKAWLDLDKDGKESNDTAVALTAAIEEADKECGSCGCEFDPLYKRALELLNA
jgi:exosome complex RNA-binding protein Rrp4